MIANSKFNHNSSKSDYFTNYTVNRAAAKLHDHIRGVERRPHKPFSLVFPSLHCGDLSGLNKLTCSFLKSGGSNVNFQFTKDNGYSAKEKI